MRRNGRRSVTNLRSLAAGRPSRRCRYKSRRWGAGRGSIAVEIANGDVSRVVTHESSCGESTGRDVRWERSDRCNAGVLAF